MLHGNTPTIIGLGFQLAMSNSLGQVRRVKLPVTHTGQWRCNDGHWLKGEAKLVCGPYDVSPTLSAEKTEDSIGEVGVGIEEERAPIVVFTVLPVVNSVSAQRDRERKPIDAKSSTGYATEPEVDESRWKLVYGVEWPSRSTSAATKATLHL
ncbi:hypothetical protein NMY22_g6865 [Coprinellus aureogranulatus]|nr:hypothetical protein NMY22_g6865 [Coprinellus aureogranulatus]